MTWLAPNEIVVGADAREALGRLRTDYASLTALHPEHIFRPAPERLERWQASGVDAALFHSGFYAAWARYAALGLSHMLPLHRVLVGAESARVGAFGGFHHPDQGYRHLQMVAVITMHGPLEHDGPQRPDLALLDLLRAYAHDCLHYGSRRRYVTVGGKLTRTQYGINFRRASGRSYSAADHEDACHTRNLGVVMEGACDREARRIAREAAARSGVEEPEDVWGRLAFRDTTGTLTDDDLAAVPCGADDSAEAAQYAAALRRYESRVNRRYGSFLEEFAPGEQDDLHDLVLRSVISGDTGVLAAWLDARHGPGTLPGSSSRSRTSHRAPTEPLPGLTHETDVEMDPSRGHPDS
ncbi:hypothetical protein ACIPPJ_19435 [Streptomyces sp. NPDC086091]|uniref:hypothetical protein n=1 Tax=Streptomyces sp. NPDC086091 TaxID=3365751 RepID=UPI0037F83510